MKTNKAQRKRVPYRAPWLRAKSGYRRSRRRARLERRNFWRRGSRSADLLP
jgi:hypothetical protein